MKTNDMGNNNVVEGLKLRPYKQEFRKFFSDLEGFSNLNVKSLAGDDEGNIYFGYSKNIGLIMPSGNVELNYLNLEKCEVRRILKLGNFIIVGTDKGGIFIFDTSRKLCNRLSSDLPFVNIEEIELVSKNEILVISDNKIYDLKIEIEKSKFKILKVTSISTPEVNREIKINSIKYRRKPEAIYIGTSWGLFMSANFREPKSKINYIEMMPHGGGGYLLNHNVTSMDFDLFGNLWVGTNTDLLIYSNDKFYYRIGWMEGLPYKNIKVVKCGEDGDIWVGTNFGAMKLSRGEWHFYCGKRWIPANIINDIYLPKLSEITLKDRKECNTVWIATNSGISKIWMEEITLERKSQIFVNRVKERHYRMGYVASSVLAREGDLSDWMQEASDNDGSWTGVFVAAESFRYGVTKDKNAKKNAKESFKALKRLVDITPLNGFPARALIKKGERVVKSGGEWHSTSDGKWEWKADTSSDEIDAHMFAYSVYYDIVAETDEEKEEVRKVVRKMMDYLIKNDFNLIDLDGKPTTWGIFSPSYLLTEAYKPQRGLNSLEILSHLKAAFHITGDNKYQNEYLRLIKEYGYALNTIEQKHTERGKFVHHDNELAFLAYYPLFLYENDPALRNIYLMSLERTWKYVRKEHVPFWNFVYSMATGKICDINEVVLWLRNVPVDMICWNCINSHRTDIEIKRGDSRGNGLEVVEPLPPDERPISKLDGNPFVVDGGANGKVEDDGAFFLLCYWAGRYMRYINE